MPASNRDGRSDFFRRNQAINQLWLTMNGQTEYVRHAGPRRPFRSGRHAGVVAVIGGMEHEPLAGSLALLSFSK